MGFDFDAQTQGRGISCSDHKDFSDDPTKHRWRAYWYDHWDTSMPVGIRLRAYPVIAATARGAWIDPHAYHHGEWVLSGQKRLVMNGSGMSFAKQTKEEALKSLAYRLHRWAQKSRRDMNRVIAAVEVTKRLLPDCARYAEMAARYVQ